MWLSLNYWLLFRLLHMSLSHRHSVSILFCFAIPVKFGMQQNQSTGLISDDNGIFFLPVIELGFFMDVLEFLFQLLWQFFVLECRAVDWQGCCCNVGAGRPSQQNRSGVPTQGGPSSDWQGEGRCRIGRRGVFRTDTNGQITENKNWKYSKCDFIFFHL